MLSLVIGRRNKLLLNRVSKHARSFRYIRNPPVAWDVSKKNSWLIFKSCLVIWFFLFLWARRRPHSFITFYTVVALTQPRFGLTATGLALCWPLSVCLWLFKLTPPLKSSQRHERIGGRSLAGQSKSLTKTKKHSLKPPTAFRCEEEDFLQL